MSALKQRLNLFSLFGSVIRMGEIFVKLIPNLNAGRVIRDISKFVTAYLESELLI